jgi:hypothetical protein
MMATGKDLPQIEARDLAADAEQTCDEKEEESHLSINYAPYNSDELHNRYTSLRDKLGKLTSRVCVKVRSKFKKSSLLLVVVKGSSSYSFVEPHNLHWF